MGTTEEPPEPGEEHVPLEEIIGNTADYARFQLERDLKWRVDLRAYVNASYEVVKKVREEEGDWYWTRPLFGRGDARMLACLNRCLKRLFNDQRKEIMGVPWPRVALRHVRQEIPACAEECRARTIAPPGSHRHLVAFMMWETLKKVILKPDHRRVARDLARFLFELSEDGVTPSKIEEVLSAIDSLRANDKARLIKLDDKLHELANQRGHPPQLSDGDAVNIIRICRRQ